MIAAVGLIGAGVAFGFSLLQDESFEAEATIRAQDTGAFNTLAGLLPPGNQSLPAQIAAAAAERATDSAVVKQVKRRLALGASVDNIQADISAVQDAQSNLVRISATAPSATGAARLANAVAIEAANVANGEAREEYARLADQIRSRLDRVDPGSNGPVPGLGDVEAEELATTAVNLETLSTVATPIQVATRATPPDSPASPRIARNAILGGFLGLLLGLVVASVLESLDRRVRNPGEVQVLLDSPLVGVIPEHALGGVPVAGLPSEQHVAAMEMFRMARTNTELLDIDSPPRSVMITSPLPEEGKTTVAIGLALASAAAGRTTLLIEADLHRPIHAERLGLEPSPGLADYLTGRANPGEVAQILEFTDPAVARSRNGSGTGDEAKSSLTCLTAGTSGMWSPDVFGSARFAAFMRDVTSVYEFVILDTAPLLATAESLELGKHVDAWLMCVRLGQTTNEAIESGAEQLRRLPPRPLGIVATGHSDEPGSAYSYYSYSYAYRFGDTGSGRRRRAEARD